MVLSPQCNRQSHSCLKHSTAAHCMKDNISNLTWPPRARSMWHLPAHASRFPQPGLAMLPFASWSSHVEPFPALASTGPSARNITAPLFPWPPPTHPSSLMWMEPQQKPLFTTPESTQGLGFSPSIPYFSFVVVQFVILWQLFVGLFIYTFFHTSLHVPLEEKLFIIQNIKHEDAWKHFLNE